MSGTGEADCPVTPQAQSGFSTDEDVSPELVKLRIMAPPFEQTTPVAVKIRSSTVPGSNSTKSIRKRKIVTTPSTQSTILRFFGRQITLTNRQSASVGFVNPPAVDTSSIAKNKDDSTVKPKVPASKEDASKFLDQIKSTSSRQRRESKVPASSHSPPMSTAAKQQSFVGKVTSLNDMKRHSKLITEDSKRRIQCTICDAKFLYNPNDGYGPFYSHFRQLHGTDADAPYPCYYSECGLRWCDKSRWIQHKSHEKDRPYACDISGCDKRYKYQGDLNQHKNYVHSPSEDLKFQCSVCDNKFYNQMLLISHSYCHSPDKNYPCLICGKSYKHKQNLVSHIEDYHISGKITCPLCKTQISSKCDFKRHMALHERDNNYYCSLCEESFDCRNDYIDHVVTSGHQQKAKEEIFLLGIPRCFPIESKDEYHDPIYFEPSDVNEPHYLPCQNWKLKGKCKNCKHVVDCKAIYLRDKKWIVQGKIKCDQLMGIYLWDFVEMDHDDNEDDDEEDEDDEDDKEQDDDQDDDDEEEQDDDDDEEEQDDDDDEEEQDDDDDEEEQDDDDDEEEQDDDDDDKPTKFHYYYGGQYQGGFKSRTYTHLRGCDGKKVKPFFSNPRMKKRCAALYGQPEEKKDPIAINLIESNLIDDLKLTNRRIGGINSSWGCIAVMKYMNSLSHTYDNVPT